MGLNRVGYVELPGHVGPGGFDHAAVHRGARRLYVAHTANDAVDVIDLEAGRYLRSISGLKGVAGVLVSEAENRIFTSNRGENTVSMFSASSETEMTKIPVGARPNGLAYDPGSGRLLVANVGDPSDPGSADVTLVDTGNGSVIASIPMPGRTRWAIHDPDRGVFFVNIADPPEIVVLDAGRPGAAPGRIAVPARGPHGLDLDPSRRRLYCACDEGKAVMLDSGTGGVLGIVELSGAPDVVFLNRGRTRLYVAIGDPGVIDVIDTASWTRAETVVTEQGAHTLAYDEVAGSVWVFLPRTHRAAVFQDAGGAGRGAEGALAGTR